MSRNRQLLRHFASAWRGYAVGGLALLVTNALALSIPRQIGGAVQYLKDTAHVSSVDVGVVGGFAWAIVALAMGAALARVLSRLCIFNAGRYIEYRLRNLLFSHLTVLDRAFFERSATGDLTSRVVNDVTYVRLMFGFGVLHVLNTGIAYVIVMALMLSVSWQLTLCALAPYPIIFFTVRGFTRAIYRRSQIAQASLSLVSARAQENLAGAMVVRAFAIQDRENRVFRGLSDQYMEDNLALARVRAALTPFMGVIGALGMLIVLWVGGLQTIAGEIGLGEYIEFSAYVVTLAWPTTAMGWVLSMWNRGTAAFDRLGLIMDAIPAVARPEPGLARAMPTRDVDSGEVRFEKVSLTYEDGTEALHDVDLVIPAGSTMAVVGRTGSGKSTLVDLIVRLRDPTSGRVTLDGVDLRHLDPVGLRAEVGYVPQDPFLFSMTVEENIRMGERFAFQRALTLGDAVKIAGLEGDVTALPAGLQTLVGERGVTLSGGQRQRVTIARAVIGCPRILILDDALSSVDTHTERGILQGLREVMAGRTSVIVTHRFSALALVDQIVVLSEGRIAERGTHEELLAQNGIYERISRLQQMEDEE